MPRNFGQAAFLLRLCHYYAANFRDYLVSCTNFVCPLIAASSSRAAITLHSFQAGKSIPFVWEGVFLSCGKDYSYRVGRIIPIVWEGLFLSCGKDYSFRVGRIMPLMWEGLCLSCEKNAYVSSWKGTLPIMYQSYLKRCKTRSTNYIV